MIHMVKRRVSEEFERRIHGIEERKKFIEHVKSNLFFDMVKGVFPTLDFETREFPAELKPYKPKEIWYHLELVIASRKKWNKFLMNIRGLVFTGKAISYVDYEGLQEAFEKNSK